MGGVVGGGDSGGASPAAAAAPVLNQPDQHITAGGTPMGAETLLTQRSSNIGTVRFNGRQQVYRTNLGVPAVPSTAPVDPSNPATALYGGGEAMAGEGDRNSGGFGDVGEPGGEVLGGGGGAP